MSCPGSVASALLLLSLLCSTTVAATTTFNDELAEGHERVRQMAHRYDVINIDTREHSNAVRRRRSVQEEKRYSHPHSTSFHVQAFGKTFLLQLELNTVLIPDTFQVQSFKANGELIVNRDVVNCYYQGEIDGYSDGASHAVISTCHGVKGSFGFGPPSHWTKDKTYFIEPLTSEPSVNGTHPHAIFKAGDSKEKAHYGDCGVHDNSSHGVHDHMMWHDGELTKSNSSKNEGHHRSRRQTTAVNATKYVELLLVLDATLYQRFNRDVTALVNLAQEMANFVDSVYRSLNIRVPLVAVQVFSAGDRFVVSTNANTLVLDFNRYRESSLSNIAHDNAQLVSGLDFDGTTIGLAGVGAMCSFRSTGVNQYTRGVNHVAATISHEMGHNFGMGHDSPSCDCTPPGQQTSCIMHPSAALNPPETWSTCSVNYLETFLNTGAGFCLFNQPITLFGDPVCGNGFVEGSEQCDCGTRAQCTTSCCDPATCRFTTGSQCSDGPCCNNCTYRATGTLCRAAVNSCDVPETCSGLTHKCPNNIFVQNGEACGSGSSASYCYDGECTTLDAQCKTRWGSTAAVAPQVCFDQNRRGTSSASCGRVNNVNVMCAADSVRCGRLQCVGGAQFPLQFSSQTRRITISEPTGTTVCKSTSSPASSDIDLSLVADGSPCAANSLCVSQQCRTITSLGITPCPSSGGKVCSGNGVCTNLNSCLCNDLWTGADCSQSTVAPINGNWSPWTTWSGCSQSCGSSGVRTRSRDCDNPPPSRGGAVCQGATTDQETCNRVVCPVPINGAWAPWGSWEGCSASCGGGNQMRVRTCTNPPPSNGGQRCPGQSAAQRTCNSQACPTWSSWSSYSTCTKICGGGSRTRTRTCPVANACSQGTASQTESCNTITCAPVPGVWTEWTAWNEVGKCYGCPQGSYRSRTRNCTTTSTTGMPQCSGAGEQRSECPVCRDGGFSNWSPWYGDCNQQHNQYRDRSCTNPPPTNGGAECEGVTRESSVCARFYPWSAWRDSGNCSLCGEDPVNNFQTRHRACNTTLVAPCEGDVNQTRSCPACTAKQTDSGISSGGIAGVVIALLAVATLAAVFYIRKINASRKLSWPDTSSFAHRPRRQNSVIRSDSQLRDNKNYSLAQTTDQPDNPVNEEAKATRVSSKTIIPRLTRLASSGQVSVPFNNKKRPSTGTLLTEDESAKSNSPEHPSRPPPAKPIPYSSGKCKSREMAVEGSPPTPTQKDGYDASGLHSDA